MDEILGQLGGLLLGSVPTIVFVVLLYFILQRCWRTNPWSRCWPSGAAGLKAQSKKREPTLPRPKRVRREI